MAAITCVSTSSYESSRAPPLEQLALSILTLRNFILRNGPMMSSIARSVAWMVAGPSHGCCRKSTTVSSNWGLVTRMA
eukprot:scaffold31862_cov63-Phaeocystis_antarctica.AAC.14